MSTSLGNGDAEINKKCFLDNKTEFWTLIWYFNIVCAVFLSSLARSLALCTSSMCLVTFKSLFAPIVIRNYAIWPFVVICCHRSGRQNWHRMQECSFVGTNRTDGAQKKTTTTTHVTSETTQKIQFACFTRYLYSEHAHSYALEM